MKKVKDPSEDSKMLAGEGQDEVREVLRARKWGANVWSVNCVVSGKLGGNITLSYWYVVLTPTPFSPFHSIPYPWPCYLLNNSAFGEGEMLWGGEERRIGLAPGRFNYRKPTAHTPQLPFLGKKLVSAWKKRVSANTRFQWES